MQYLNDLVPTAQERVVYLVSGVILFLLIVYFLYRFITRNQQGRKIKRILRKISKDMMSDIMLPDGLENLVHIDYILLRPDGLFVIDLKDYAGLLFGGEKTDQWAQVVGRKSYKFDNPLYQIENKVLAVKSLIPEANIEGLVVFTEAGEFPKGKPDSIYMLDALSKDMKPVARKADVSGLLATGWDKLNQLAQQAAKA